MNPLNGVHYIQGDINRKKDQDLILEKNNWEKFDIILSDMCPEFSGDKLSDHSNLIELNHTTIKYAQKVLKKSGSLVLKTFEGALQRKLQSTLENYFGKIHKFKPTSSRSESSEMYLVCQGFMESEKIKEEAERIKKMTNEEFFEEEKSKALHEYRMKSLDNLTFLEDLDKLSKEIKERFSVDPETIKYDEQENEKLRSQIEEENYKANVEIVGEYYKPKKAKTLLELTENYFKDAEEQSKKLLEISEKEKIDISEIKEFLKFDEEYEYKKQQQLKNLKDTEYERNRMQSIIDQIQEEEKVSNEITKDNFVHKFERWEKEMDELNKMKIPEVNEDVNPDKIEDELQKDERNEDRYERNLRKNPK